MGRTKLTKEAGVELYQASQKLAGVRAELGNINLTHLCKYIPFKVAVRGF